MQPDKLLIHQRTMPTRHPHCELERGWVLVECLPSFAEYLPPWERSAFRPRELNHDFGRIHLPPLLRWSK